jgi:hypothetical protein
VRLEFLPPGFELLSGLIDACFGRSDALFSRLRQRRARLKLLAFARELLSGGIEFGKFSSDSFGLLGRSGLLPLQPGKFVSHTLLFE